MRRAALAVGLLALVSAGCGGGDEEPAAQEPSGPCAAEREQPSDAVTEQGDLDGDGEVDDVVTWLRDGQRVVQVRLASGERGQPEPFDAELMMTADLDGDQRDEVVAATGASTAGAWVLDGCRLARVRLAIAPRDWVFASGRGAARQCRPAGAAVEVVTTGPETIRRAWRLMDGAAHGADPTGSGPVEQPGISC